MTAARNWKAVIIWHGAIAADTHEMMFVIRGERKRYVKRMGPGWCRLYEMTKTAFRDHYEATIHNPILISQGYATARQRFRKLYE